MTTCIYEPNCDNKPQARDLCTKHYYKVKRDGTLEQYPTTVTPIQHKLSDVNADTKKAICSVCGPDTDICMMSRWRCLNKSRELWDKAGKKRGKRNSRRYRYGNGETIPEDVVAAERKRLASDTCIICGTKSDALHLDHCHDTGKIRGLLCQHCNWGLGHFKDNIDTLKAAISYLEDSR